jgi:hypothetical protein
MHGEGKMDDLSGVGKFYDTRSPRQGAPRCWTGATRTSEKNFFPALRWIRAKGRAEAIKPRPSPLMPVPVRVYRPPRARREKNLGAAPNE